MFSCLHTKYHERLIQVSVFTVLSAAHCCITDTPSARISRIGVTVGAYWLPQGVGVFGGPRGDQNNQNDGKHFQLLNMHAGTLTFPRLYLGGGTGVLSVEYDMCHSPRQRNSPTHP